MKSVLVMLLFALVGCGAQEPNAQEKKENLNQKLLNSLGNHEISLNVKSSFGHFSGYTPPRIDDSLKFKLHDIIKFSDLKFIRNGADGIIVYGTNKLIVNRLLIRETGIIEIRLVSDTDTENKIIFDIELFTVKKEARGWLVLESDSVIIQGIAGLEGVYK